MPRVRSAPLQVSLRLPPAPLPTHESFFHRSPLLKLIISASLLSNLPSAPVAWKLKCGPALPHTTSFAKASLPKRLAKPPRTSGAPLSARSWRSSVLVQAAPAGIKGKSEAPQRPPRHPEGHPAVLHLPAEPRAPPPGAREYTPKKLSRANLRQNKAWRCASSCSSACRVFSASGRLTLGKELRPGRGRPQPAQPMRQLAATTAARKPSSVQGKLGSHKVTRGARRRHARPNVRQASAVAHPSSAELLWIEPARKSGPRSHDGLVPRINDGGSAKPGLPASVASAAAPRRASRE